MNFPIELFNINQIIFGIRLVCFHPSSERLYFVLILSLMLIECILHHLFFISSFDVLLNLNINLRHDRPLKGISDLFRYGVNQILRKFLSQDPEARLVLFYARLQGCHELSTRHQLDISVLLLIGKRVLPGVLVF